jgi:hypothetical protein
VKYMIEYTIRSAGLTYDQNLTGAEALLTLRQVEARAGLEYPSFCGEPLWDRRLLLGRGQRP